MGTAANRLDKLVEHEHLYQMFTHVPEWDNEAVEYVGNAFDFREFIADPRLSFAEQHREDDEHDTKLGECWCITEISCVELDSVVTTVPYGRTAVYRHFAPDDDRFDLHTLRFRYTTNRDGEYLLGLDEWCPPDRPVSAQQLGMLTYVEAYFASYDIHVSMAVPVFEPGNRADDVSPEQFTNDAELRLP